MKPNVSQDELAKVNHLTRPNVISEYKYHDQIVDSARHSNKAQFNLILSLLTQDATEFDQFYQQKNPSLKISEDLYKQFHVTQPQLVAEGSRIKDLTINELTNQSLHKSAQLLLNLHPDPLHFNLDLLPSNVVNNLDHNARLRLQQNQQKADTANIKEIVDQNNEKEKELQLHKWFDVLQQARTIETAA